MKNFVRSLSGEKRVNDDIPVRHRITKLLHAGTI